MGNQNQTCAQIIERLQTAPALILAAHPDDETIGASSLLARFPAACVAFLTDGAPRDTRLWSAGLDVSREQYAAIRRQEATTALGHVGISKQQLFCLRAVDQEAMFEITRLIAEFGSLLSEISPAVVVSHPFEGGHPDHDTAAVVARIAVSQLHREKPLLLEMTSYHARDGRCVTGEFLQPGSTSEFIFELSEADRERKRRMIGAYTSQRLVLKHFPVDREPLRIAPDYDFTKPPHDGKLWYECMGWPMTGQRWRELATAALSRFQECSCG